MCFQEKALPNLNNLSTRYTIIAIIKLRYSMNQKWILAKVKADAEEGINFGDIIQFKENLYKSLVRELLQNSLDERRNEKDPVRVVISDFQLRTKDFPGKDQYLKHVENCIEHWSGSAQDNERSFFNGIKKTLQSLNINVLRFSDFNTNGIIGSDYELMTSAEKNTPWKVLVKQESSSTKGASQSGSYGIGKYAAFAASKMNTVFYSTYDKNGLKAYEGVSKLATHTFQNQVYGSRWYYGNTDEKYDELSRAVPELLNLDPTFVRNEVGSDVFIMGFDSEDEYWQEKMQLAIVSDFFIPIHEGSLEVGIGKTRISTETLEGIYSDLISKFDIHGLTKYRDETIVASQFYRVLTDTKTLEFTRNFDGLGEAILQVIYHPDFNRRVIRTREVGMTLFSQGNISSNFGFAGIVRLKGKKLSQLFRNMENPAHNRWGVDYTKPEFKQQSKALLEQLNAWIRNTIRENAVDERITEMDVVGLGNFLPLEDFRDTGKTKTVDISGTIQISTSTKPKKKTDYTIQGLIETQGQEDDESENTAIDTRPTGKPNNSEGGTGTPFSIGIQPGKKPLKQLLYGKEYTARYVGTSSTKSLLHIQANCDISNPEIQFAVSGESGTGEVLEILSATDRKTNKEYNVIDNKIMLGDIEANEIVELQFQTRHAHRFSLEVMMYEN